MKKFLRKMLTFIITITMVFAVTVPVTAYYEQYFDCVFEYADYDFEHENCNLKIELEQPIALETDVESDYNYLNEYEYFELESNYGYGCVDSEIDKIEEIESTEGEMLEPIVPFGQVPSWVPSAPKVIVPAEQDYVDFSVTLDVSAWSNEILNNAPLGLFFPTSQLTHPGVMPVSVIQNWTPQVGLPSAFMLVDDTPGITEIALTIAFIENLTHILTLDLRLNILAVGIPNPGDYVDVILRRGLLWEYGFEDTSIRITRGGNLDVTYAPGVPSAQTPGTAVRGMPVPLVQPTAIGSNVTVAAMPNVPGYNFTGWLVSGGPAGWTLPGVAGLGAAGAKFEMPHAPITLTAQWTQAQNQPGAGNQGTETITVTFDLQGGSATFPLTQTVRSGARVSEPAPPPTREKFTFAGWYTAEVGGTQFNFATPITANTTIFARWHSVLIKLPDRMTTQIGDTISWTLKGFHNPIDFDITNFAIIDAPGLGLNFKSGRLPAFTNGSGVTYDILYRIDGDDTWRTYRAGVDASRPYNFSLPQDGSTYYPGIKFYFGDVPVGFGLGNEIVLKFIVGYGAPNNELVNRFFLFYNEKEIEGKNPDKPTVLSPSGDVGTGNDYESSEDDGYYAIHDREYFEIEDPNVPLSGFESYRISNVPQTGVDGSGIGLMLLSLLALAIFRKRKTGLH